MESYYVAKPCSRVDLRKIAKDIRRALKLSEKEAVPIVKIIEWATTIVGWTFEVVEDEELPGIYAVTVPQSKSIKVSEGVYQGAVEGNRRDRFTLAHEFAHFMLHRDIIVGLARSNKKIPAYEDPEWQANVLAAELLIPVEEIGEMSIGEIADLYEVSYTAASIQKSYTNKSHKSNVS